MTKQSVDHVVSHPSKDGFIVKFLLWMTDKNKKSYLTKFLKDLENLDLYKIDGYNASSIGGGGISDNGQYKIILSVGTDGKKESKERIQLALQPFIKKYSGVVV